LDVAPHRRTGGRAKYRGKSFPRKRSQGVKKNDIKPHNTKQWVIPPEQDAVFVCAMENVLAVYERPYDERFPVVCLDEQPKQLIAETRQTHQCSDRTVLVDYQYERKGTASIFMSFEPLGGKRFITVHDQHTHKEWASVVADLVENRYAGVEKITLVGDNLSTHKLASL
jgi:DDE superfamily endonuclease